MKLVDDARRGKEPVLSAEGGDAFFKEAAIPKELHAQWKDKAAIIAQAYGRSLDVFVPGELDMSDGAGTFLALVEKHRVPVVAANLVDASGAKKFPAFKMKELGKLKLLVVGVVDPAVWPENPTLKATDAVAAVRAALKSAPPFDVAMLIAHATQEEAEKIVIAVPEFSFVLTGHTGTLFFQPKSIALPAKNPVEEALTFASSKSGKYVARLTAVHVKGDRTYTGGEARSRVKFGIEAAEKKLKSNPNDAKAKAELDALRAKWNEMEAGSHADFESVGVETALPEDAQIAKLVGEYNKHNAEREAQVAAAQTTPVPTSIPPTSPYAGVQTCRNCHVEAYQVWEKSDHHRAMASLRKSSQQYDRECVGCHTTGYQKPGGFTEPSLMGPFAEVQCEACHDAARAHAERGEEVSRASGEAVCRRCHTPDATPQFQFDRDRLRIKHWKGP